jgi:Rieske 2Fe-2S family protein
MYDKAEIRSLLAQHPEGFTLPQGLYSSQAAYEFDLEAIFHRSWLQVGIEGQIPEPGDYFTYQVGASSIVVLREQGGGINAFFNTCRHRGAPVCSGAGHAVRLVCPYHQWSYDLSGKLKNAPRMHEGFNVGDYALKPVRVETVAGIIFACLSDGAPDFGGLRGSLEPMLEPHELRKARIAHTSTLVAQGNWKLVMENARECYHCRVSHPELMQSFRDFTVKSAEVAAGEREHRERCEALGLKCGEVIGPWYQVGRYPLGDGVVSYTLDGKPAVSKKLGRVGHGDVGAMWWGVNPHCFNHVVGDYGFLFQAMPLGPQETLITGTWIVHQDAVAGVDYDLKRLTEVWEATDDQDRRLAENNQRGVNNMAYRPGPYSRVTEELVLRLVEFYCAKAREFLDRA